MFLALVSGAMASNVTEQAEWAIRELVTSSRQYSRVYISNSRESFLSFDEARVTGEGHASSTNGWGGTRFTFSIKVQRNDLRTRDARVEFENGRELTSGSSWNRPSQDRDHRVRITSPRWYETVRGNTVTLSGVVDQDRRVLVTVYDRNGRVAAKGNDAPGRDLRWSVSVRLGDGTYRAVATQAEWNTGDEVRFTVGRSSGSWNDNGFGGSGGSGDGWGGSGGSGGSGGDQLSIMTPRNGGQERGPRVRFAGRSDDRTVQLEIFRGSRRVVDQRVGVSRRNWESLQNLSEGDYRVVVRDGRGREERRFRVTDGDWGGSGGSGGGGLPPIGGAPSISSPGRNSTVRGPEVRFSGNSRDREVSITVYMGNRKVWAWNERVNGGRWSGMKNLGDGDYRVVVQNRSGGGTVEHRFTVRERG